MATHAGDGEGNGSQNGSQRRTKFNISSTNSNLQVADNTVLIKTDGRKLSTENLPNVNLGSRRQHESFMDNAEFNIKQEGGNVSIAKECAIAIINTGKPEGGEDSGTCQDETRTDTTSQDKKTNQEMEELVHPEPVKETSTTSNILSQQHTSSDEELQNDLSNDQPKSDRTDKSTSNIPPGEPFDRFDSRSGPAALSLRQSKHKQIGASTEWSDTKGQMPLQNISSAGSKKEFSDGSILLSHNPKRKTEKSGKKQNQNIPVNSKSNIPSFLSKTSASEQSPRQSFIGGSIKEADGTTSTLRSQRLDGQSNISDSSLHGVNLDPRSRVNIDHNRGEQSATEKDIHICVREKGQWVQIGQCCVIVELNIDDKLVEQIKQQGEFSAQIKTGEVMVNMRWGDLEKEATAIRTSLKVEMQCHTKMLESEILKELFRHRGEKLIKTMQNVFKKCNSDARIVDVTKGCFQFNFIHLTQSSVDILHSEQSIQDIQEFLNNLLITDKIRSLAGTDGINLRVISLREQFRNINTMEEMRLYQLVARERNEASLRSTSPSELRPSEIRYQIQDVGNEVQTMKNTLRSHEERMQENAAMLGQEIQQNAASVVSELKQMQHSHMAKQQQVLDDLAELIHGIIPRINNLETKVTQIDSKLVSVLAESEIPQTHSGRMISHPTIQKDMGEEQVRPSSQTSARSPVITVTQRPERLQQQEVTPPIQIQEEYGTSQIVLPGNNGATTHGEMLPKWQDRPRNREIIPVQTQGEINLPTDSEQNTSEVLTARHEMSVQTKEVIQSQSQEVATSQLTVATDNDQKTSECLKTQGLDLLMLLFGGNVQREKFYEGDLINQEALLEAGAMSLPVDSGPEATAGASAVTEDIHQKSGFLYQLTYKYGIDIQRIQESILIAMQAEEDPPPRASGIDTVLCLDTSESMNGIGMTQLKKIVQTYLDGVEENATEHGLEENVAVITFGESVIIQQHLTNEFNSIRDVLDNLKFGGRTPMLEALLVSVFALIAKGTPVDGDGYKIFPRIVLISDGQVSSYHGDSDKVEVVDEAVRTMILSVILKMKQHGINYPITCIPVGDSRKDVLEPLAVKTNGQMLQPVDAAKLSKHYQIQSVVGRAVSFLSQQVDPEGITVEEVVNNLTYEQDFDMQDRDYIKTSIQNAGQPQPDIIFFDDFCIEEYPELPPLGHRVRRKKKAGHEDGTIVSHLSECEIEVIWDSGDFRSYNMTKENYKLTVIGAPRGLEHEELNPPVGTLVKRGADWRYDDQDGGIEKIGVVIGIEPGLLRVCWRNGRKNFYRFGYEGCCDVVILDKTNHRLRYPKFDSELDKGVGIDVRPGLQVSWKWKDDKGKWWRYPKEQMRTIEEAYSKKLPTCVLGTEDNQKRLLLDKMEARDVGTGIIHPIDREEIKP